MFANNTRHFSPGVETFTQRISVRVLLGGDDDSGAFKSLFFLETLPKKLILHTHIFLRFGDLCCASNFMKSHILGSEYFSSVAPTRQRSMHWLSINISPTEHSRTSHVHKLIHIHIIRGTENIPSETTQTFYS